MPTMNKLQASRQYSSWVLGMKLYLAYVIACLGAAGSFLLNKALLRLFGVQVIITLSPVLEEAAKTLSAFFLGADLLVTHLTFGLIEAVYDWSQSEGKAMLAALLSILGHGLFGVITLTVSLATDMYVGLAAGMVAHLVWNAAVLRLPFK